MSAQGPVCSCYSIHTVYIGLIGFFFFPVFLAWEKEQIVHLFSAVWSPSVKLFQAMCDSLEYLHIY